MSTRQPKIESRNEKFADKASTRIWKEIPSKDNPYVAERCLCHGYDLVQLMEHVGYVDMLFLLIRGQLPTVNQRELLEALMVGICNPGPRHPATRAAMNAGVSKTNYAHVLPLSLTIMGGEYLGGGEVEASMRFIRSNAGRESTCVAKELVAERAAPVEGDWHIAPGFGQRFGGCDIIAKRIAEVLLGKKGAGKALSWSSCFAEAISERGLGWLTPAVVAASLLDLGFHPRYGAGMYELLSAPGLLAHGMELANKPITAMPFIDDEHYVIDE